MISSDDLTELRDLLSRATSGDWGEGHLTDDSHPCDCRYVFSQGHMGAIATIGVDNGLSISHGGNDAPCLSEAKANLALIVKMKNLLPQMLAVIEGRS